MIQRQVHNYDSKLKPLVVQPLVSDHLPQVSVLALHFGQALLVGSIKTIKTYNWCNASLFLLELVQVNKLLVLLWMMEKTKMMKMILLWLKMCMQFKTTRTR